MQNIALFSKDVLRNWNARLPEIVSTADQLVENAKNCIAAFNQGTNFRITHWYALTIETNCSFNMR